MVFIPKYLLILAFTIVIDYFAGILIEKSEGAKRKLYLVISLISNISILAIFKYFNFLAEVFYDISNLFSSTSSGYSSILDIILPIGLSFHTFQAMSYTIEVFRRKQKAERNFLIYSLYVMFYPQLVAGPIERPQNLLHQFREKHIFDSVRFWDGMRMIIWGLFIKTVIADRLAIVVDESYNHIDQQNALNLLIATVFFAFQIYCDFAGYSSIAIGAAKVMGFTLMANFNMPYISKSIAEFWKRWHISLSTWFRDYLYIPLGGNRVKVHRWYFNLFFVFLVSGLWHGANWTFVIWGALHGFYLIVEILLKPLMNKIFNAKNSVSNFIRFQIIARFFTFLAVLFAWIFFRAANVHEAFALIGKIIRWETQNPVYFPIQASELLFSFLLIIILLTIEFSGFKLILKHNYQKAFYFFSLMFFIFLFGIFSDSQFIYFQF